MHGLTTLGKHLIFRLTYAFSHRLCTYQYKIKQKPCLLIMR